MMRLLPLLLAAACAAPAGGDRGTRPEVLVSAAASLTNVLDAVARRYEAETSERIVLNVAASNVLARQIRAGARVDLFISADDAQMDAVIADVVAGTRVPLLSNRLVIAVPSDRPIRMASPRELLAPAIRRVAVGEPSSVPAGVYARDYLRAAGVWEALQSRLIPAGSVRLALAAVESGAADAAIVFRTDVASSRRAIAAWEAPAGEGPAIVYPAAIVSTGANPDGARRFLAFLQGRVAADLFRAAGFIVP